MHVVFDYVTLVLSGRMVRAGEIAYKSWTLFSRLIFCSGREKQHKRFWMYCKIKQMSQICGCCELGFLLGKKGNHMKLRKAKGTLLGLFETRGISVYHISKTYLCVCLCRYMNVCVYICMYKCIYMHMLPSFVCWKGQEAITPQWVCPDTLSTPSTHILVSNTIPHWKEPGFLGETVDSRAEAGYIKDEPGKFYYAIN